MIRNVAWSLISEYAELLNGHLRRIKIAWKNTSWKNWPTTIEPHLHKPLNHNPFCCRFLCLFWISEILVFYVILQHIWKWCVANQKTQHSCKIGQLYCCSSQPFFVVVCFINYCPFIKNYELCFWTNFFVWKCRQYYKYFITWLFRVFQRINTVHDEKGYHWIFLVGETKVWNMI